MMSDNSIICLVLSGERGVRAASEMNTNNHNCPATNIILSGIMVVLRTSLLINENILYYKYIYTAVHKQVYSFAIAK
jgi:hypothetical protein